MVRELIVGRTECEDTSEEHAWAVLRTACGRFRGRRTDGTDKLRSFRPEASESAPRLSLRELIPEPSKGSGAASRQAVDV